MNVYLEHHNQIQTDIYFMVYSKTLSLFHSPKKNWCTATKLKDNWPVWQLWAGKGGLAFRILVLCGYNQRLKNNFKWTNKVLADWISHRYKLWTKTKPRRSQLPEDTGEQPRAGRFWKKVNTWKKKPTLGEFPVFMDSRTRAGSPEVKSQKLGALNSVYNSSQISGDWTTSVWSDSKQLSQG